MQTIAASRNSTAPAAPSWPPAISRLGSRHPTWSSPWAMSLSLNDETYDALVAGLDTHDLMILGFSPADKKQYGVLEIDQGRVSRITEWKYWKDYPADRQDRLTVCNSGIYAVRKGRWSITCPSWNRGPRSSARRSTAA
jgi:hypothetical protein